MVRTECEYALANAVRRAIEAGVIQDPRHVIVKLIDTTLAQLTAEDTEDTGWRVDDVEGTWGGVEGRPEKRDLG